MKYFLIGLVIFISACSVKTHSEVSQLEQKCTDLGGRTLYYKYRDGRIAYVSCDIDGKVYSEGYF